METLYRVLLLVFLFSGSLLFLTIFGWIVCVWRSKEPFSTHIYFGENQVSDTSIPTNANATATAAIVDSVGSPVPGAVFDAAPSWSISDPSIAALGALSGQTAVVNGVAAGSTTLSVGGTYLGNVLTAQATVTVTGVAPGDFHVNITWS